MTSHLSDRAVIRLSPTAEGQKAGEDVRAFLQGLVTNDTGVVAADHPVYAALLTAQGKCLFDFILWGDGGDVLIDCEADAAEALAKRLSLYRLRRAISIAVEPSLYVHWSLDGDAPTDPRHAPLGRRWLSKDAGEDATALYHAHRLSLGIAEGAVEIADILWLETNAVELNGVSFTKGCYVGQENTARMNWRSKVNRRIVVVPIAQSNEKRRRIAYPDLGLSVEHWRVEDMGSLPLPEWQGAAISAASETESGD
jgi:tRNA-modifying protein YgfZ